MRDTVCLTMGKMKNKSLVYHVVYTSRSMVILHSSHNLLINKGIML